MHIPDGFLSTPVWATLDVAAAPAVGYLARRAQRDFDYHKVPLMGVMGAFIFAAQMINFPVGNGTSGHLVGGALLACALGPAAASIVMTAILATQALIFQDGGLLALGANVFNMALAGVWIGYLPYALLRGRRAGVFFSGFVSLLVSAVLALSELLISGVRMPPAVLAISFGLFVVSAVIEGAITMAVVQALERIQPDFLRRPARVGGRVWTTLAASAAGLACAGFAIASTRPDGIESLARNTGLWSRVTTMFDAPLAGYQTAFIAAPWMGHSWMAHSWMRHALAGLAGLVVIYVICAVVSRVLIAARPH